MAFNSLSFALFLPVFLLLYYAIYNRSSLRDILLLAGSYVFYMSWYWQYAGLIAISTLIDYPVGRLLATTEDPVRRKLLVTISLVVNLGILGIFGVTT